MTLVDTGLAGLTLIFLFVVAGLSAALIALFCAMERSARVTQFREAVVRRIDQRFEPRPTDRRH